MRSNAAAPEDFVVVDRKESTPIVHAPPCPEGALRQGTLLFYLEIND
jgi:hypothetical protein